MSDTIAIDRPARFTLRQLLLAFAGVCGVLGLYVVMGYGPASVLALGIGLWLTWRGARLKRPLTASFGILLSSAAGAGVLLALVSWHVFGTGPIYLPEYYPARIQRMIRVAEANPWQTTVYCHSRMGPILEDVCRMDLSPAQVEEIVRELELPEVSEREVGSSFRGQFPRRWRPRVVSNARYYHAMVEATDYTAMYDPQREQFYVWCVEYD